MHTRAICDICRLYDFWMGFVTIEIILSTIPNDGVLTPTETWADWMGETQCKMQTKCCDYGTDLR